MRLKTPLLVSAVSAGLVFGGYLADGDRYLAFTDDQVQMCWHTAHRTVNESDSLRLLSAEKRRGDRGFRVNLNYHIKDVSGLSRAAYAHCTFSERSRPTYLSALRVSGHEYTHDEVRLIRDYGLTLLPVSVSNH